MSETAAHEECVAGARSFIIDRLSCRTDLVVYSDDRSALPGSKPPLIGGFRPDVLVRTWEDGAFFIGEGKSTNDLLTKRSRAQLSAFLAEVRTHAKASFVLCVPFGETATARALLFELGGYDAELRDRVFCTTPSDFCELSAMPQRKS